MYDGICGKLKWILMNNLVWFFFRWKFEFIRLKTAFSIKLKLFPIYLLQISKTKGIYTKNIPNLKFSIPISFEKNIGKFLFRVISVIRKTPFIILIKKIFDFPYKSRKNKLITEKNFTIFIFSWEFFRGKSEIWKYLLISGVRVDGFIKI